MGIVICVEKIGRCVEGKFIRRFVIKGDRIWISRRVFVRAQKKFRKEDEKLVKMAELRRIE